MSARRLFLCAAVLHVTAALMLFVAGAAQVAPAFIDRDGIIARLADDSLDYQKAGIPLTRALQRGEISVLTQTEPAPLHVRAIALCWLLLSPLLLASGAVVIVRGAAAIVVSALLALGLALLLIRQFREKRSYLPNVVCAIVAFGLVSSAVVARVAVYETTKQLSNIEVGEPKATSATLLPTVVVRTAARAGVAGWLDRTALHAGSIRNRYAFTDPAGGSGLDHDVAIRNTRDAMGYFPRALTVGLWAPFPSMWLGAGHTVGRAGRMVSGMETLVITGFQLIALVDRARREPRAAAARREAPRTHPRA